MSLEKKFRVAIVGGGISGLSFALSLEKCRANVEVDIYEGAAAFSEVGAGMAMWPRVLDIMNILGLGDDLAQRRGLGEEGQKFTYRKADQADGYNFGQSRVEMFSYHRAEFLEALVSKCPSHYRSHFNKRLVSFDDPSSGPITISFKDGTTAECDLLIGADGIKSSTRGHIYNGLSNKQATPEAAEKYRGYMDAKWTGQVVYRALVRREDLRAAFPGHSSLLSPVYYVGKDKYVISYPISGDKLINCAALVSKPSMYGTIYEGPWVSPVTHEEMMADFPNWEPQTTALLNLMKNPSRWVVNTVVGLPTFVSGRVALIGDAAHAMVPHQAAGAGQGVEDALVLANLLAQEETQKDTVVLALEAYDEVRRPFAQNVLDLSYKTGEMYYMQNPRFEHVSPAESSSGAVPASEMQALDEELASILRWTWTTTIQGDRDRAIERLKSKVKGV